MRSHSCRAVCEKFRTERTNSAFPLNRLQANGADAAIKLPLEVFNVVESDKADSGHERSKRMTIFFLPRGGQRTEGTAMKGILQRQQTPLGFVAIAVLSAGKGASQLERAFPGFGAAVAEERFVQAGDFRQAFRQVRLELVKKQIRDVNQPASLAFQRRLNHGVRVSQRVDPDPAQKIQVALAL